VLPIFKAALQIVAAGLLNTRISVTFFEEKNNNNKQKNKKN